MTPLDGYWTYGMQTPGINYRLYADWRLDRIALTPGAWMLQ